MRETLVRDLGVNGLKKSSDDAGHSFLCFDTTMQLSGGQDDTRRGTVVDENGKRSSVYCRGRWRKRASLSIFVASVVMRRWAVP